MAAAPPPVLDNDPDKIAQMEFDKMASQVGSNWSGICSLKYNADKSTATKRVYHFEYYWHGWFFSLFFRRIHCPPSHTR